MKSIRIRLLTSATVLFSVCFPMKAKAQSTNSPLPSDSAKWTISRKVELKYLYYLPNDYDQKSKKRWPLMLFLHGAGERQFTGQ